MNTPPSSTTAPPTPGIRADCWVAVGALVAGTALAAGVNVEGLPAYWAAPLDGDPRLGTRWEALASALLAVVLLAAGRVLGGELVHAPHALATRLLGVAIGATALVLVAVALGRGVEISLGQLAPVAAWLGVLVVLRKARAPHLSHFVIFGAMLWISLLPTGLTPALAGLAVACTMPMADGHPVWRRYLAWVGSPLLVGAAFAACAV